jgi:hypothetical protein
MNKNMKIQELLKSSENIIGARIACLVVMAGLAAPIHAQEWTFDPIVRVGAEIDDNANLSIRTDEEVEITGYTADLTTRLDYLSSVTNFYVAPRVRWRKFDESEFDSTDLFLRLNYRYRTRASTFAVRASAEREAVRTAERADTDLDIDDPGDITNDDSGLVQLGGDRDKIRIRPSWQYRFSNTFAMMAAIDYFDIAYDDVFLDLLVDYTDARGEIGFSRALSDRTTGLIIGTVRRFENSDNVLEFDGYGAMVGFERAISETTSFRALIGVDSANFDADNVDDETAVVADVSLTRQLETIRMLAQYKRSITASGTRVPTIRDNFNLNFSRRLSERIDAGLGARVYRTELISGVGDAGRDYVQLTARLGWNLSPIFLLEFELRHTILDRGGVLGESADSNQAAFWFVYRPNRPTSL